MGKTTIWLPRLSGSIAALGLNSWRHGEVSWACKQAIRLERKDLCQIPKGDILRRGGTADGRTTIWSRHRWPSAHTATSQSCPIRLARTAVTTADAK